MVNYWVVRAGRKDQPDIQKAAVAAEIIGMGWAETGDIRNYDLYSKQSKELLKQELVELHQENDPGGTVGQFRQFVHEIEIGDIVLLPVPSKKQFHVGRVIDHYDYSENNDEHGYDTEGELTHRRKVEWIHNDLPYSRANGALRSTLATVNKREKYASIIRNMLEELDHQQHSSGSSGGSVNPVGTPITSTPSTERVGSSQASTREGFGVPTAKEIPLGEDVTHYTLPGEWASTERIPPETDWQAANEKRAERTSDHQQLVQAFADELSSLRRWVGVFDLAVLAPSGVLLAEMKTLDGTPEDERRQVRAAISQLLYYEGLCLPAEFEGQPVTKVAVFDKQPSPEHTGWMESLKVAVVWQDENKRFVGLPPFTIKENA